MPLRCSTSLWSADLANLAGDLKRVEPCTERFHLDVADGHYVHNLLFFPDLVRALRRLTATPFEVHLMTTDPLAWIDDFVEAGADLLIFCNDSTTEPGKVVEAIRSRGKKVGVSLLITEDLDVIEPFQSDLDLLTIVGTAMGVKGATMDPTIPDKIRRARALIESGGLRAEIQVDGGIRRNTVPLFAEAGADWIVPGSLMFGEDPAEMRRWLQGLDNEKTRTKVPHPLQPILPE